MWCNPSYYYLIWFVLWDIDVINVISNIIIVPNTWYIQYSNYIYVQKCIMISKYHYVCIANDHKLHPVWNIIHIFLSETHTGKALLCVYILLVGSTLTSKRRRNSYLRSSSLHYIEYVFTEGSYSYYTAHCSPQSFSTIVYNGASFYFLYCVCVDGRDVFYFWHTWYRYTTLFYKGRQKILRQKCTKTICYCYYHCPKYIFALFKNTISIMGNAIVHFIRYAHEWKDYFVRFRLPIMPLLNTSQLDTSAFEAVLNIFTYHKGI